VISLLILVTVAVKLAKSVVFGGIGPVVLPEGTVSGFVATDSFDVYSSVTLVCLCVAFVASCADFYTRKKQAARDKLVTSECKNYSYGTV